jgi:regulation of enolase protein 1 (concanavalin A-like superfamily)
MELPMKKILRLVVFLCLVVFTSLTFADGKLHRGENWQRFSYESSQADFYVSPNGDDAWSGTLSEADADKTDGPFLTIHRAQQAVRDLKAKVYSPKDDPVETRWIGSPHKLGSGRDILVLIRGGQYSLNSPLVFTPLDGGERVETNLPTGAFEYHKLKDYYVTYAAYPGEKPVLSGGKRITGWEKKGDYWETTCSDASVEKLVANGKMQKLARTPNEGYMTPPKMSPSKSELVFTAGQLQDWPNKENNKITMLLRWHTGVNSLVKIDEAKGIATFKKPQNGVDIIPPRYYVENVKALMDAPGEWYFDVDNSQLSFIPPTDIKNPNDAFVVSPGLDQLVNIFGAPDTPVRNLRIYGLSFQSTKPGAQAIALQYAHANEIVDCNFKSLAGGGILVDKGCYQTHILSSQFKAIDFGAISVNGIRHPEDWTDIIRQTTISYNQVDDCGGTSIYAYNTLFTTISHNEVTDNRGRYAISVGGWTNLEEAIDGGYRVEYNHCHNVQKLADDSGVIKTAGLTFDSIVRRNLVHDVKAGYFNDNVGFWFDNMSSGWLSEENIFYDLQQGEMKLCAANLVDNLYQNNFIIEAPEIEPEGIIEGDPDFEYGDLSIGKLDGEGQSFSVGDYVKISAEIKNRGWSGLQQVSFMHNGQLKETKLFPVIRNNKRAIDFVLRLDKPGQHRFAIGSTSEKTITASGEKLQLSVENINLSQTIVAAGETITCSATVTNLGMSSSSFDVALYLDEKKFDHKVLDVGVNKSEKVSFSLSPKVGDHKLSIGNSQTASLSVFDHKPVNVAKAKLKKYISGTARGTEFDINQKKNNYKISATGTDFYHAEDSYGSVFMENVTGNFIATVQVTGFGHRTHEWFRAGLFARNKIDKSFDTEPGSKGSVLMFTTPGRAGIHWDEFGDGCMHKAKSENLPVNVPYPIWIKLVRRGNTFTGYISLDGENWTIERNTNEIPGLKKSIDLGLAAGSCDEIPYWAEFEDFQVSIEK